MGKKGKKLFKKIGKVVKKVLPVVSSILPAPLGAIADVVASAKKPKQAQETQPGGEEMGLPATLPTLANIARGVLTSRAAKGALSGAGAALGITSSSLARYGARRRKKSSLTMTEMGKLIFMGQALGKRNPVMTLMVMKALGGRL